MYPSRVGIQHKRSITCVSVMLSCCCGPWGRRSERRSCRTTLAHCKQISTCSERQLDSPHNYSQRHCTHTPQWRPDRVRAYACSLSSCWPIATNERGNFNVLYTVRPFFLKLSCAYSNSDTYYNSEINCARLTLRIRISSINMTKSLMNHGSINNNATNTCVKL